MEEASQQEVTVLAGARYADSNVCGAASKPRVAASRARSHADQGVSGSKSGGGVSGDAVNRPSFSVVAA